MSNLPDGWEKIVLNKVADVRSGVAKGKKGLKELITLPYLRVANVQDGYLDLSEVKELQIEKSKIERYSLKNGDVLMNEGGDFDKLGRGTVWQGQIDPCLHQNHVFAVRPNPRVLSSYFLSALAESHYGKSYFLRCAKRSTNLASINSTQIKGFPVLLPPLPEQQKIADILSTWDNAITTTEQLLANGQQQKKALMQQLLTGKKRLQDENGDVFCGDWNEIELGGIGSPKMCKRVFKNQTNDKNGIPFYKISTFGNIANAYISEELFNEYKEKYSYPKVGDILISASGTIGKLVVYDGSKSYYQDSNIVWIDNKEEIVLNSYLFYVYENLRWKTTDGGIISRLYNSDLKKIKLKLPPLPEQQAIANVLKTADQQIDSLQQQIVRLKDEKKGLMQVLLSGKKRVSV